MAFSTQKEFFNLPFMNETIKLECRKLCVKLKSYESNVDDRSWALNDNVQSRYLNDLVNCRNTRIVVEEGGSEFSDKDEENSYAVQGKTAKKDGKKDNSKNYIPLKESKKYKKEKAKADDASIQRRGESDKNLKASDREGSDRNLAQRTDKAGRYDVAEGRRGVGKTESRESRGGDKHVVRHDTEGGSKHNRDGDKYENGNFDNNKNRKGATALNGSPSRQTDAPKRGLADGFESIGMRVEINEGINNSVVASKMAEDTTDYNTDSSDAGSISKGEVAKVKRPAKKEDADKTQATKRPEEIGEKYAPDGTYNGTVLRRADDILDLHASPQNAQNPQDTTSGYRVSIPGEMGLQSDGSLIHVANSAMAHLQDMLLEKNNFEQMLGDANRRLTDTAQERDELRDRLGGFAEMERKIHDLQMIATNAGIESAELKGSISNQLRYIHDMENEFQKTEDYYKKKLQSMEKCKRDAQHMVTCLKEELKSMRKEVALVEPLKRQNTEMNQNMARLKSALYEYDFMYKQLLEKVEIFRNQGYSFDIRPQTKACTCTCSCSCSLSDGTVYSENTEL